jgi:hypothetical protein
LKPYDPPAAETAPARESGDRLRAWAYRVGWLNIACAPGLVVLATAYHLFDDSSMAGVLWVLSFPVALLGYALPGALLMLLPRAGWVLQIVPLGLSCYTVTLLMQLGR